MNSLENLTEQLTTQIQDIIQDSLQLGFDDFTQILKTIPITGLHHLSKILMQERQKYKITCQNNESTIQDLKSELKYKEQEKKMAQNELIIVRQEIQDLKIIMNQIQKQNDQKYEIMNNQSQQMIQNFQNIHKIQKQNNIQLQQSLLKLKENNHNELKRLEINNQKLEQENQLLKRLNDFNKKCIDQNTLEIEEKTLLWKEKEKQLRMENEQLREKIMNAQKKNEQLQYFVLNQIIKVKYTTSEQPNQTEASHKKQTSKQASHKNNDNCFKGLQLEYYNKFVGEYKHSDKRSQDNSSFLLSLQEIQQQEKDKNNSIDKSDSLSLKGTIISSSKALIDQNLFEHQSCESKSFNGKMFGNIQIADKNNQYVQPFLAKQQMQQKQKQKTSSNERPKLNTALNKQKFFKIIEQNKSQKSALSDRSVKTDFIQQRNASTQRQSMNRNKIQTPQERIRKNVTQYNCLIDNKSPLMDIISKDKQIEQLKNKLEYHQKNLLVIQKNIEQLQQQKNRQNQYLKTQVLSQIENINKLNMLLQKEKLNNVYLQQQLESLQQQLFKYHNITHQLQIDNDQLKTALQAIKAQYQQHTHNNSHNNNHNSQTGHVDMQKYIKMAQDISLKQSVYSQIKSEKNMLDDSSEYLSSATKTVQFNNLNEPLFQDQNQNTPFFNAIETQTTHQLSFCSLVKNTVSFLYNSPSNHTSSQTSEENLLSSSNKQSSAIKKFIPLQSQQQLLVDKKDLSNIQEERIGDVEAEENNGTIYYSFEEILTEDKSNQQNQRKENFISEIQNSDKAKKEVKKSLQLDPLKQIAKLQALASIAWSKLGIFNFKGLVPDISSIVVTKQKILPANIISRNRNSNKKQFYLLNCLLESNEKFLPDKLLLWRQGIASLRLGQCLLMAGIKKFIYDSECWSFGNSEIIVENSHITIKRMTKRNYLYGDLGGNKWKLIEVQIYGTY